MVKVDIYSGFLGAGKTTLIKKLIKEAYAGERVVLIENEFGEIGIDGGFLKDAGIEITEMNSGCICCSLVGDFTEALGKVEKELSPDRIIIEPSGVGKLSDVVRAVKAGPDSLEINCLAVVVDANKCKMYMKNFGEFFNDQIEHASAIILSHTTSSKAGRAEEAIALIKEHNSEAVIISTDWEKISGADILSAMENKDTLEEALKLLAAEHKHHHDHDEHEHHHEHGEDCTCGCHGHHDHDEHEHHHEHGEDCTCGCHGHHDHDEHEHHHEHDHHHDHGENCTCGCHGHHHHHADDIFESFGIETVKKFDIAEIESALDAFTEDSDYGMVLRAKGIVEASDGRFIHFDYVPGEPDVRYGSAALVGRLCVIGTGLDKDKITELFGV